VTLLRLYEQLRASEAGLTSAEARMRLGRFGSKTLDSFHRHIFY
jgi:hypothetical protein